MSPSEADIARAWALRADAQAALDRGEPLEAESAIRAALQLLPEEPWFHSDLGRALSALGQPDAAEAACRRAIDGKPDEGWFYEALGRVLTRDGRHADAIEAFSAAIARDPREAWFHYRVGRTRWRAGLVDEARRDLETCVRLNGSEDTFVSALADILQETNHAQEAVALFERALALDGDDAWRQCRLAEALVRVDRITEAESRLRTAETLDPHEPWFPYMLAELYLKNGRLGEAIAASRRARAIDRTADWVCVQLGEVFTRMGAVDEARTWYQKACRLRARALGHLEAPANPVAAEGPHFIIAGFPKCGTTSLYEYLVSQNGVFPAAYKEPGFFSRHYARGIDWYRSLFVATGGITGEASTNYATHPAAPSRVRRHFPEARLVFLVRDPVLRAFSDYRMWVRTGVETRSFARAVDDELSQGGSPADDGSTPAYVSTGLYAMHLRRWAAHIPKERMLILRTQDLARDPRQMTARTLDFLGLPGAELVGDFPRHNEGHSQVLDDVTARRLGAFYAEHNEALRREFGVDI